MDPSSLPLRRQAVTPKGALAQELAELCTATVAFCERHYRVAATLVLGLAAFNLTFRIGQEVVTEWDESLYAISAWEMSKSGNWIGTTLLGQLDYYNTKPPLNVWCIALGFTTLGVNLIVLRLPSIIAAWTTVLVLQQWAHRHIGAAPAIFASAILSTMYAFIYVHAGRSANTDAMFTMLIVLTAAAVSASQRSPWHRVWFGPLLAATFLLRGLAMLMPLAMIGIMELQPASRDRRRWLATGAAVALFVIPVGVWAFLRWQLDGSQFLERMVTFDFIARTARALEGHRGGPLYYLNILQKYHYDWLVAGLLAWALFPSTAWPSRDRNTRRLLITWGAVTFLVPTIMQTKVPWYLNPFYPLFGVVVGWVLVHSLSCAAVTASDVKRRLVVAVLVILAVGTAEGRLIWYSYNHRDLSRSVQGLFIGRDELAGHHIFRDRWNLPDTFVVEALARATPRVADSVEEFVRVSEAGDYYVSQPPISDNRLTLVSSTRRYRLYRRQ